MIAADFERRAIEQIQAVNPGALVGTRFHYVEPRPWHFALTRMWELIEASCLKPVMNSAYRLWQKDAFRLAGDLHREIGFDLMHLVTMVGYRFPAKFYQIDVPFVWGPIGGLENTHWRFLPLLGFSGCGYYSARNMINSLDRRFLPDPKRAFAKAAASGGIIAATGGIRREIKKWYGHDSEVICEIGPPAEIATEHSLRSSGEPLKLAWSGRHDAGKCLPLLLKALALLPADFSWNLTILGQGPDTAKWRRLSRRLGLEDRCRWTGWLERDAAVRTMHDAHLFVITSMKDLTSTVLLEALSQGLPVVCPDHCGFTDVVTADCGIRLPVHSPRQLIADLAAAIRQLGEDETERRRLAAGALRRIGDFSWEKKAAAVDAIYRRAVEAWGKNRG
ncbi:MAG: glycosyltransferase [Rhodopirellula sp.]|nr:glycosyltransferase [Rhodopirellula sp.]